MRPFASKSRLLHSAKRRDLGGDQASVNADHSVFEPLRNSPDAPDVATKKITSETEFGVVGKLNGFFIFMKPEKRSNGPERLLSSHFHPGGHIREHSRF